MSIVIVVEYVCDAELIRGGGSDLLGEIYQPVGGVLSSSSPQGWQVAMKRDALRLQLTSQAKIGSAFME
jgi:hypothetical protein